jgi:hypothetical protein
MSLNDLSTTPIADAVDFNDLPEQMGGYAPPPQPGPKRFKLSKLGPDNFDKVTSTDYGERVKVKFDGNAPLVILQSTLEGEVGDPFTTVLTNVPRKRGKGEDAPVASDMDYLLKALKVAERPKTMHGYADALMIQSNQAAEFTADIEWSARCAPERDAQWPDGNGGFYGAADASNQPQKGCGTRVYQRDLPKVDGKYQDRVLCPKCGASVRAFANLTRFRE